MDLLRDSSNMGPMTSAKIKRAGSYSNFLIKKPTNPKRMTTPTSTRELFSVYAPCRGDCRRRCNEGRRFGRSLRRAINLRRCTVTGVRFYKGSGNTGTHIGMLYSSTGALLAQATFTGETASGWQQVNFSSSVAISANTTYIAAFFTTSGYADNQGYFTSTGVDNAPLHALKSGVDGLNGVYMYGAVPQFPSLSWADSNYWVDVVCR